VLVVQVAVPHIDVHQVVSLDVENDRTDAEGSLSRVAVIEAPAEVDSERTTERRKLDLVPRPA
jgi:hypothetical protein